MIRRLAAVSVAALCAFAVTPAHAATTTTKLYLNQLSDNCADSADFAITASADDSGHSCVYVDRVVVNGAGTVFNESFSGKKLKTYTLDAKKKVTGTFALFGSALVSDGPSLVSADFTVKIAKKKIGVVHVEGMASPTAGVTKSFSFSLPAALNKVKSNSVSVNVEWSQCVGPCYVGVSGTSFLTVPTR